MYQMLSDDPRTKDRFGFEPMAEILAQVIRNTKPPFTIGIFGEWGSGKTTLMNLIDSKLRSANDETVWFNAWKYDGKEVVWNALIQSIFFKMREQKEDEDFQKRVAKAAKNLALFAARKSIGVVTGGMMDTKTFDGVIDALSPLTADGEQFKFINEFEATFRGLVTDFVGESGRLVIFVDDLDRCLPETAVEVLEAIKLYLDSANVTFVIGVEPEVVRAGIRHRYKNNETLAEKEYLEKIVQLPFAMRGLDDTAAMELIRPYEKAIPYYDDEMIVKMLLHATESNPRRIKRFINTFYVLSEMHMASDKALELDDRRRLALVLLMQMHFREAFGILEADPGIVQRWNSLGNMSGPDKEIRVKESETLKSIDADKRLRKFFGIVEDLDCSSDMMLEWVLLTRGE